MQPVYILGAVNPIVSLYFLLTFFLTWRQQPHKTYILNWALIYAAAAAGFSIELARLVVNDAWVALPSNFFFGFVGMFTARGTYLRYRGKAPDLFLVATYCVSVGVASLIDLSGGSAVARGTTICAGMALVMGGSAIAIVQSDDAERIDRCLAVSLLLCSALMMARPIASLIVEGNLVVGSQIIGSFWDISLKLVTIVSWPLFGILFMLRISGDLARELVQQSLTDALSGALNRRGFFEKAKSVLDKATPALPAAVMIFDIDHFKQVNDRFGHSAGDQVIEGFAATLKEVCDEIGVVGRLGGEEFGVVVPNANISSARVLAEGVRTAFRQRRIECVSNRQHVVTASVGITEFFGDESLDAALERADTALYSAKRDGRDRVVCDPRRTAAAHPMRPLSFRQSS